MTTKPQGFDPLIDALPSRYVVGIDLGTTNSAVSFVDTRGQPWQVQVLDIPQLVAPGEVESRETLPSFHYQPAAAQLGPEKLALPWHRQPPAYAVGVFARDEGSKTSGRQIASAKSWLSHAGVDRTAELLPWHSGEDVQRLSPVEVSSRYLQHIRQSWDARFPQEPLADQDVVLTLPASFDEVARELTVAAAQGAGLPRVALIEEPQAAFYAWVYKHVDDWDQLVAPGQKILVCDIGGGTTDFTLIRVRQAAEGSAAEGKVQFHRVAVGNHLILGGDNLDVALARHVEQKIAAGGRLPAQQWDVLVGNCRRVKEQFLGPEPPAELTINLPRRGARLIGGSSQVPISRAEVYQLLVEGFLPRVSLDDKPQQRSSGFQEFGLPYAADPAITRYLAAFLTAHRATDQSPTDDPAEHDASRPDVVLLNGGFFASPDLRGRLLEVVSCWYRTEQDQDWSPTVLDHDRLDLAVARGAAYYGMVRRGDGVRIAASLARSYYISVEDAEPVAVCLVPGSAEPGQEFELQNRTFQLAISQPVEFPLFVSSTRLTDQPGQIVAIDAEQMTPMPPIRTVLKTQRRSETGEVPVSLHIRLTEIGTIELWCRQIAADRSWRLQFDVRAATQTDVAAHQAAGEAEGFVDETAWHACEQLIRGVFAAAGGDKPGGLVKRLALALDADRAQWPMSLLRRIWEALMQLADGRRRSGAHEARWLNLLGYALRPGYGLAVDDWRVTETWRTVHGKLIHNTPAIRAESCILWRRLAGGLSAGQQSALAELFLAPVRGIQARMSKGKSASTTLRPEESHEVWRLLGSLELLSVRLKIELGDLLVDLLPKRRFAGARQSMVWALGRLGQRQPVYGHLNTVVPGQRGTSWLQAILHNDQPEPVDQLAVMQLARRTDDRYRDLVEAVRAEAASWLADHHAAPHLIVLVRDGGSLESEEQNRVFGETLPKGLRLQ